MKLWPWPHLKNSKTAANYSPMAPIEKIGENLNPNLRALRLTMTISDMLLSMGVPALSVVSKALDITETYCKRPVHVDISANLIMLSQIRGMEKEPLTLIRPVALRDVNNMTIQDIQRLVYEIRQGKLPLEQAENRLDTILKEAKSYPWWVIMLGNASIAAAVSLMFTKSWQVVLTTFAIGMMVDRVLAYLVKRGIPSFFRQVGAAMFATMAAALVALMGKNGIAFFEGMNPTLIVVGGIIMLVAGLAIVGAIQDAIDEYYITAASRILKVLMLTTGIVVGILISLYIARWLGFGIAVSPDPLRLNSVEYQLVGGGLAAAAFALATQTRLRALLWAGVVGGLSLAISYEIRGLGVSVITASGAAAVFAGVAGSLFSRLWRTPSYGIIAAGILPLVPGLALYNGLMQLVNYPAGSILFSGGLGTLFTAFATALAIAAGASFGSIVGRPLHQKLTHTRNVLPFIDAMRRQLKFDPRRKLASAALRQPSDSSSNSAVDNIQNSSQ